MGDPFLVCPFDKSHKIMMSRFQSHLLKCMKSHSPSGPMICPFNSQHIIDASQIVEHCIICPNIKDVLMQTNIREYKSNSSNNDVTSIAISRNSAPKMVIDNIACSNTKMNIEAPNVKSLRRPKNEKPEKSIKIPDVRGIERSEESNNPSQDVSEQNSTFQDHHTIKCDTGSKNSLSLSCDEPELLENNNIDYGEIYRRLEALEEKRVAIAKERQILRQKENEIEEQKKELIEIFKNIAVYMDTNSNHRNNNDDNNKHRKKVVTLMMHNDEGHTNTGNDFHEYNEHAGIISNSKLKEKSSIPPNIRPSLTPQTSSFPTPGSSPNTNNSQAFGRGIAHAYNQRKVFPNNMNRS